MKGNKLTTIEMDLLRAIDNGFKPRGDSPELKRLLEMGVIDKDVLNEKYKLLNDGWLALQGKLP